MDRIKFVHTADLHLDTPFKGLSNWNSDLASKLKDATFKSFRNIINLCIREKVDFLLISGDIFDSENKSLAAQLKFAYELKRLRDNGISVYFVCGNHDPLSSWLEDLQMPENVFRYNGDEVVNYSYNKNNNPAADIYGISYKDKIVNKNLAHNYKIKNKISPFSIAILHGTAGVPGKHENYAPFKVEDIIAKGFDYWALGHIHKRQIIKESDPAIVYPGNPQGRDFGETGSKGCYIIELSQNKKPEIHFISTQLIRFEEIEIDLSGIDEIGKLDGIINNALSNIKDYEESTSYILRIAFKGRTSLHSKFNNPGEIDQLVEYLNTDRLDQKNFIWIDKIDIRTEPDFDMNEIKKGSGFTAEILKSFEEFEKFPESFDELIKESNEDFCSYQAKRQINISEDEHREIMEKAKWLLFDLLVKE